MIECVFTIDYEIYGNGEGSLKELVYEPAERLMEVFRKWDARFVPFVEVAELEVIEAKGTDSAIDLVKKQVRDFYKEGFVPGLHLHPQWYKARYEKGRWQLDYSEYNLCTLPEERIIQIVDRAIDYFRHLLGVTDFTPLSFRAGNWLLQPTRTVAKVLADRGILVDSSVFKGGRRHEHNLDYRCAVKNGHYWRFREDAGVPDPAGSMLELPIHSQMVPFWKMPTTKRLSMERHNFSVNHAGRKTFYRLLDLLRIWHPLKLDFCRMTINEISRMLDVVIQEDRLNPTLLRPIVAIGHTKELFDLETVEAFLSYLKNKGIAVSTLNSVCLRCT